MLYSFGINRFKINAPKIQKAIVSVGIARRLKRRPASVDWPGMRCIIVLMISIVG